MVLEHDYNFIQRKMNEIAWQTSGFLMKSKDWEIVLNSFRRSPRDDTWYQNKLKN